MSQALVTGSVLRRNVLWNLVGQGFPLLVAVFTIPLLIHGLGTDRFGLLAVVWVLMGNFSIFDLGLGRALTQAVSEKLGCGLERDVPTVIWSAFLVMLAFSAVGVGLVSLLCPLYVGPVLKASAALRPEAIQSFRILGVSIPIILTTAGLRGVLEGYQRFDVLNAIRTPTGTLTYLGPVAMLPFSRNLAVIVTALLGGRLVTWLAHLLMCLRTVPALCDGPRLERQAVGRLLRLGSWMTVSNLLAPLMVSVDRLLIGAVVSVTAVAYYATPYEVVTKLWLVPVSVASVLFPIFAAVVTQDKSDSTRAFARGVKYTFLLVFPAVVVLVSFADQGLSMWIDPEFARHSANVLRLLAVGVLINSIAMIPFSLIQGSGRPDVTARLHLAELPAYLLILWAFVHAMGVDGVAMAWLIRATVDALLLFVLAQRFAPARRRTVLRAAAVFLPAVILLMAMGPLPGWLRLVLAPLTLLYFLFATWFVVLSPEERAEGIAGLKPVFSLK